MVAAAWVSGIGTLVLIGWAVRSPLLTQIHPDLPAMTPLTAVCFVLAGPALWLLAPPAAGRYRRWLGMTLALVVAGIGVLVTAEYLFDLDVGIDRLVFPDAMTRREFPGRPGPHTAIALALWGLGLAFIDVDARRGHRPAVAFGALSSAVALAALLGYVYGATYLRTASASTGMAVHTAVTILVLALATLLARPDRPLVRAFTSPAAGGRLARRLAPVLLLLPFVIGLVDYTGQRPGADDPAVSAMITTLTAIVVLFAVVSRAVRDVDRADAAQREALDGLRAERDFTAKLLGSLEQGVMVCGPDGRIRDANRRLGELTGLSWSELVGLAPPYPWWPEDGRAERTAELRRMFTDPQPSSAERLVQRPDGASTPVAISTVPVRDASGELLAIVITYSDLSAAHRAKARLQTLLEQNQAMIATASDAFISIDDEGRIVEWNHRAETVFGWARAEAVGRPLADTIVPPRHRDAHRDGLRRVVAGGDPHVLGRRVELTALCRDGTEIPVELALWRVRTGGVDTFHAFLHDITERLQLQAEREQLRAAAEREEFERRRQHSQRLESLGHLAGGVAHDFNNLLAVIGNYADFVAATAATASTGAFTAEDRARWHDVAGDVAQIQRASERATRLTRQLLTFGRGDVIRPEVLNLNEVVSDVEQLLRRTIGERIELVTTKAVTLSPVYADPGQVEQILVNLAVNARDAMPDGGVLSIETADVAVDESYTATHPGLAPGDYVRLGISDTGTGMTKEVMQRAFEPFFTSKPKGSGTGLGLATVYGIVTHAGGQVQLYSEPGLGTTVSVLLPATDRVATAPIAEDAPIRSTGWQTVLLVEDDDAIREVTRRILVRNGYETLAATDAEDAVRLARDHPREIHLLLTDVVMPNLLGREVAAAVHKVRPDVRVLYMSGYAMSVLASRGTLEPGATLVEKPFTEKALLDRVEEVLAANRALSDVGPLS
jgi:PAS domain S-box-containing protein